MGSLTKRQGLSQQTKSEKKKFIKKCPTCNRDFQWRKKWAKDWVNVIYCSERCRRRKNKNSEV